MIISPEQIKAARAWIDLTREELAAECRMSPATIRNLEKGKIAPRSIEAVRLVFENRGFHFHGQAGFSVQSKESRIFEGPHSREEFHEDLLATVSVQRGEVGAIFETQTHLAHALGVTDYKRPERLDRLGELATVKCLLADARHLPLSVPSLQFRADKHIRISPAASLVYGDKTAVIMTDGMNFTIHVLRDVGIAQNGLKQFAHGWESASPVAVQAAASKLRN